MFAEVQRLGGKFLQTCHNKSIFAALVQLYRYIVFHGMVRIVKTTCALPVSKPSLIPFIQGLKDHTPAAMKKCERLLGTTLKASFSIDDQYVCMYGTEQDFSHTTTAVVAHWDPQGIVDPYVIYMCQHFKSLGWKVVLVSAGNIHHVEEAPNWADAVLYRTCAGYDFTSWKAALACFPSLWQCTELILCNDSVFAPIHPYDAMHSKMEALPCDFWGITESRDFRPHLQSYYVVFRKKALEHAALKQFFAAVPLSDDRSIAIEYETTLGIWLTSHGLQAAAYAPFPKRWGPQFNPSLDQWCQLIDAGAPVFKRELIQTNIRQVDIASWSMMLTKNKYPLRLIQEYYWRLGEDIISKQYAGKRKKTFPPDVICLQKMLDLNSVSLEERPSSLSVAVVLHVYYTHILDELAIYLQHMPKYADVLVSTDTQEKAHTIQQCLSVLGFRHLIIRVFPNRGWDIGPFFAGFGHDLLTYDLIVKLHAKVSTHIAPEKSAEWRQLLFESLVGSRQRVVTILNLFEKEKNLGMIIPPPIDIAHPLSQGPNHTRMRRMLSQYNIRLQPNQAIDFPVGSMFWCRSHVLEPWIRLNLSFDDFKDTQSDQRDGTLAHAIERLFLFGCGMHGMYWGRVAPENYGVPRFPSRKA